MHTDTYTTSDGDVLTLDLTDAELAYWSRARVAAADLATPVGSLIDLLFSEDNPVLEPSPFPGRGMVTAAVHRRPVWRAMSDLLYRRQVEAHAAARTDERFTLSTADAAEQLGISAGAVRQAIQRGQLAARKVSGKLLLSPDSVAGYRVGRRGPRSVERVRRSEVPPLRLAFGSQEGSSLHIRTPDGVVVDVEEQESVKGGTIHRGSLSGWAWLEVRTTQKGEDGGVRYFRLVPDTDPDADERVIRHHPFEVVGRFRREESAKGRRANELWKEGRRG